MKCKCGKFMQLINGFWKCSCGCSIKYVEPHKCNCNDRIKIDELSRFTSYFESAVNKMNSDKNRKKPHWLDQSFMNHVDKCREEDRELYEALTFEEIMDELYDRINTAIILIDYISIKRDKKIKK